MPSTCDPQTLKTQAQCIVPCVTPHELLAAIACSLATLNGMSCSAATLKSLAAPIWPCLSEVELLAAIACLIQGGGGGGGGGSGGIDLETSPVDRPNFPLNEPPPSNPNIVTVRFYRDQTESIIWDPLPGAWLLPVQT